MILRIRQEYFLPKCPILLVSTGALWDRIKSGGRKGTNSPKLFILSRSQQGWGTTPSNVFCLSLPVACSFTITQLLVNASYRFFFITNSNKHTVHILQNISYLEKEILRETEILRDNE